MLKSRTQRVVAAAAVVIVVLGAAGWWFFLRDDAPEAASIETASKTLDEQGSDSGSGSGEGSATTSADAGDLDGTWSIDPSVGSFDDFSGTYAGYRVQEELASVGHTTAVGRTPDVTGDITIAGNQVTAASFDVDMTTLQSDKPMRDNTIRGRGLETDKFPEGTFALTEPIDLPAGIADGESASFSATGDLTLHGVTKSVTLDLDAKLDNGTIAIVGQVPITFADYGIDAPTTAIALSVEDHGTLELQLFLSKG